MGARALLSTTLCLLAVATPPAAVARRPPLEPIGALPAPSYLADRFIVSQPVPETLRVRDVIDRTSRDLGLPPACALKSARWRLALLACEVETSLHWPRTCLRPHLVFLGPGEVRFIRARDYEPDGCNPHVEYHSVGRHWLVGGDRQLDPHPSISYLNWRTGARGRPQADPDGVKPSDVDDPALRPYPEKPVQREGRLLVPYRPRATSPLRLRVGGRPYRVLSRCRAGCSLDVLAGGRVVWVEGSSTLRAYEVARSTTWTWRLPRWTYVRTTRSATVVAGDGAAYLIRWVR